MSPRAASRLESIGFEDVYEYVAGKADWGAPDCRSRARTGARRAREPISGRMFRPAARAIASKQSANSSMRAAGTPASSSTSGGAFSARSGGGGDAGEKK